MSSVRRPAVVPPCWPLPLGALALLLAGCAGESPSAPRALPTTPRLAEAPNHGPTAPPTSSLTLTLRVTPKPSALPVSFTTQSGRLAAFSLTDAGGPTLPNGVPSSIGGVPSSNSITFPAVMPGVYPLGIHVPQGLTFTGIDCTSSDGSRDLVVGTRVDGANIRIPVRAAVQCTLVAANPWPNGEMLTYSQFDYGNPSSPGAALVESKFNLAYTELDIGIPTGFEIQFSDGISVVQALPWTSAPLPLLHTYFDPDQDLGDLRAEVLALKLDVDFDDLGVLRGPATLRFGDLRICDPTPAKGLTVRQFLVEANKVIGNGTSSHGLTLDNMQGSTAANLGSAFPGGVVSPYAAKYLVAGASCP